MSILTNFLPAAVKLDGQYYPVYTDFRRWVRVSALAAEAAKDPINHILHMLDICYVKMPQSLELAMSGLLWFLGGGKQEDKKGGKKGGEKGKRIYDFEADANYIFSAFYQQYGIDLTCADLHWWKFMALLQGLSEECQFVKIMQYRGMDLSQIKDKDQKRHYKKLQDLYRLPDIRTQEEKERDFVLALDGLF